MCRAGVGCLHTFASANMIVSEASGGKQDVRADGHARSVNSEVIGRRVLMSSQIEQVVRERYGSVAKSGLSSEHGGVRAVAEAFGYTAEELSSIPAEANMGLSCGNPTATASLREGEVVVDLGSGGGLDVFLAAEKVGPTGRAVGIDMTPEMLERARRNAAGRLAGGAHDNVEFHLATIDRLPLADAS